MTLSKYSVITIDKGIMLSTPLVSIDCKASDHLSIQLLSCSSTSTNGQR